MKSQALHEFDDVQVMSQVIVDYFKLLLVFIIPWTGAAAEDLVAEGVTLKATMARHGHRVNCKLLLLLLAAATASLTAGVGLDERLVVGFGRIPVVILTS